MRILVDMDGVLADFEGAFLDIYRRNYPDKPFIPLAERNSFYLRDQYAPELRSFIEGIYNSPGFYLDLPLIKGSAEGLQEMISTGHDVWICTAPSSSNPTCIQDKFDWLNRHFGSDLTKKLIVTGDKTIVRGDILIDDRPEVTGAQEPSWQHILYSQPYNANITSKRRLTWDNWRSVI
jgi:5'-nucleotidase